MPKRIVIEVAEKVCKEQQCRQIIIVAWDGELTHIVTYGMSRKECDQAALGGRKIAAALGLTDFKQEYE